MTRRTHARAAMLALLGGGVAVLAGCPGAREAADKQSAARITRAIEVVREAPNEAKAAPLAALRKEACDEAEICGARDRCAAAYAEHLEGVELTARVRAQISGGNPGDAASLLDQAQRKLAAASQSVADCADREAALRRRFKL